MNAAPSDRALFTVGGEDRLTFLQGLLTNDVLALTGRGIVYAALLTPQGKYLADMFVVCTGGVLYLDMAAGIAPSAVQRLMMYRLRADVQIAPANLTVTRGMGAAPEGSFADPRHPALGWRYYGAPKGGEVVDWAAIRVAHVIPETGIELLPNDSYILEMGLDRLNGVSFRKGCYVGQEVTARMRHKAELKKGLVRVAISGAGHIAAPVAAPVGTPIMAGDRAAGVLFTQSGGFGLAYLRFDWGLGEMQAGDARLTLAPQS